MHSYRPSLRYSVCLQPGAEEEKEWKGNVSLIVEEEEKNDQQENNEDNGPGHDDGASQDNIHVLDESVLIDDSERMNDSPSPIVDASPSIVSSPLAPSVLPIPRTTPLLQHNINSLNESIPNDENVPPSNHTTPAASGSARASLLLSPIPIARASKSPDRIPLSDIQNVVNDDFENDKNDSIYKSPSSRLSYSRISSASIQPSIERDVCEQHTSVTGKPKPNVSFACIICCVISVLNDLIVLYSMFSWYFHPFLCPLSMPSLSQRNKTIQRSPRYRFHCRFIGYGCI